MSTVERINLVIEGDMPVKLRWQDCEPEEKDRVLLTPLTTSVMNRKHPYNRRAAHLVDQVVAALSAYPQEQIVNDAFQADIKLDDGQQIYLGVVKGKPYLISSPLPFIAIEVGKAKTPKTVTEGWLSLLMSLMLEHGNEQGFIKEDNYLTLVKKHTVMPDANLIGFQSAKDFGYVEKSIDKHGNVLVRLLANPALGKHWLP